jgi:hypothetical protein
MNIKFLDIEGKILKWTLQERDRNLWI